MTGARPRASHSELTPEQTARVEYGLARDVLSTHRPIVGWDTGPDGTRRPVEICSTDFAPWPCDTDTWAMERINTRTDAVRTDAPVSPAACDAYPPASVAASNGFKRDEGEQPDDDAENPAHD